jgi:hypothetical protein
MSYYETGGPWSIRKGGFGVLHVGPAVLPHPSQDAIQYAAVRGDDLLAEREAAARLIAAAPDMIGALEALLKIAETIDDDTIGAVLDDARAIIADAKGSAA